MKVTVTFQIDTDMHSGLEELAREVAEIGNSQGYAYTTESAIQIACQFGCVTHIMSSLYSMKATLLATSHNDTN